MKIAIVGAGAVGAYFGGRLAQAKLDVTFIARGETLKALQRDSLQVNSINGNFRIDQVKVTADPKEIGPVDFVLMAVKAWQVNDAAKSILPLIGRDTGIAYLGNGVEAHEQLESIAGKEHVLGGLCRISAYVTQPVTIQHVGINPTVVIGELDNLPSSRMEDLKDAFIKSKVEFQVAEDILAAIWQKFIFIAAISGIGALTRSPIGVTRSLPETRRMLESAISEIVQVADAKEINLPADQVTRTMAFIDGLDPSATASMQRDIADGKPSELEYQNGAVVRLGRAAGVQTPLNQFIYGCLLPQELKARK